MYRLSPVIDTDMLITTLPTILLQIFCTIVFNFLVIIISMIDPDNNIWMNTLAIITAFFILGQLWIGSHI